MEDYAQVHRNRSRNPYKGPDLFTEADFEFYKGRERRGERTSLAARSAQYRSALWTIRRRQNFADLSGTHPKVKEEGFEVLPLGDIKRGAADIIDPSKNIFLTNLINSLAKDEKDPEKFRDSSLVDYLKNRKRDKIERALIIDHLEEIFEPYPNALKSRKEFFQQLTEAIAADPQLYILLSVREEFVSRLDRYRGLMPGELRTRLSLELPGKQTAIKMIEGPTEKVEPKRTYDPVVTKNIVEHLTDNEGHIEPIQLQVVCYEIWESLAEDVSTITNEHLEALAHRDLQDTSGSSEGAGANRGEKDPIGAFIVSALEGFYERSLTRVLDEPVDGVSEDALRRLFSDNLIRGDRLERIARGETETAGVPETIIARLIDCHLIRSHEYAGAHYIELTHNAMVNPIRDANEKAEETRYSEYPWLLTAQKYHENRNQDLLLRGSDLKQALKAVDEMGGKENQSVEVRTFLQDSQDYEVHIRDRIQKIIGWSTFFIIVIFIVFIIIQNNNLNKIQTALAAINELKQKEIVDEVDRLLKASENFENKLNREGSILTLFITKRYLADQILNWDQDRRRSLGNKFVLDEYQMELDDKIIQLLETAEWDETSACQRNMTFDEWDEIRTEFDNSDYYFYCNNIRDISFAQEALQKSMRNCGVNDITADENYQKASEYYLYSDQRKEFWEWALPQVLEDLDQNGKRDKCLAIANRLIQEGGRDFEAQDYLALREEINRIQGSSDKEKLDAYDEIVEKAEWISKKWDQFPPEVQPQLEGVVTLLNLSCTLVPKEIN